MPNEDQLAAAVRKTLEVLNLIDQQNDFVEGYWRSEQGREQIYRELASHLPGLTVGGADKQVDEAIEKEIQNVLAMENGVLMGTLDAHRQDNMTWIIRHMGMMDKRMAEIQALMDSAGEHPITAKTPFGLTVDDANKIKNFFRAHSDERLEDLAIEGTDLPDDIKDRLQRLQSALRGSYATDYPDDPYKISYEKLAAHLREKANGAEISVGTALLAADAMGVSSVLSAEYGPSFGKYVHAADKDGNNRVVGVLSADGKTYYPVNFAAQGVTAANFLQEFDPTFADMLGDGIALDEGAKLLDVVQTNLREQGLTTVADQVTQAELVDCWSMHCARGGVGVRLTPAAERAFNHTFGPNAAQFMYEVGRVDDARDPVSGALIGRLYTHQGEKQITVAGKAVTLVPDGENVHEETLSVQDSKGRLQEVGVKFRRYKATLGNGTECAVFAYESGNIDIHMVNEAGKKSRFTLKGGSNKEEYGPGRTSIKCIRDKASYWHGLKTFLGNDVVEALVTVGQALTHCSGNAALESTSAIKMMQLAAKHFLSEIDDINSKSIGPSDTMCKAFKQKGIVLSSEVEEKLASAKAKLTTLGVDEATYKTILEGAKRLESKVSHADVNSSARASKQSWEDKMKLAKVGEVQTLNVAKQITGR